MALPTVVAGDNLNFPLVGSFLQHAGLLWHFHLNLNLVDKGQEPCGFGGVLETISYIPHWFRHTLIHYYKMAIILNAS